MFVVIAGNIGRKFFLLRVKQLAAGEVGSRLSRRDGFPLRFPRVLATVVYCECRIQRNKHFLPRPEVIQGLNAGLAARRHLYRSIGAVLLQSPWPPQFNVCGWQGGAGIERGGERGWNFSGTLSGPCGSGMRPWRPASSLAR